MAPVITNAGEANLAGLIARVSYESIGRPTRAAAGLAVLMAGLVGACESVKVVVPDVARVEVTGPAAHSLLLGQTVQLTVRIVDADGNSLTGRTIVWTSSDTGVATVSDDGLVTAVAVGTASIRATVDGRSGAMSVTVVDGPAIGLEPEAIAFLGTRGGNDPAPRTVDVLNVGALSLRELSASVAYSGSVEGWLTAILTTTAAPAQLRLSVDLTGLDIGTYEATVTVSAPSANNSPQTLAVTLEVADVPPSIGVNPASVGFGAIEGESDPSPIVVSITNQGNGVLSGMAVEVEYGEGATDWLQAELSSTTAPATLTLRARTGDLGEGVYLATVRIVALHASNSPREISVTFTVGSPPPTDVATTKSGPDEVDAGAELEYVISTRNNGPALAVGVVITDTLPDGAVFVAASDGGQVTDGVVTWPPVASLAVGQSVERRVTVRAPPSGELLNVAASTVPAHDPEPGNNDGSSDGARVVTQVIELADLAVLKSGPDSVGAADAFEYTLVVSNGGPSPAVDVVVQDRLPPQLTLVSASGGGQLVAGVVVWPTIDTLPVLDSRSYTVTVRAPDTAPAGGTVENVALAVSDVLDPVPENSDGSSPDSRVTTRITNRSDVTLTKVADAATVVAGGRVTYTIEVTNHGPSDAGGVRVTDQAGPELTHVANTPSQGTYAPGSGVWSAGTVAAGASARLTLVMNVDPGAAGPVVNEATVTSDGEDPNPADNTASVASEVTKRADLSVTKKGAPDPVEAGGRLTYTIEVTNGGPSRATGVAAVESLPPGVSVVSAAPSQGSYATDSDRWTVGALAPGATAKLVLVVNTPDAGVERLVNSVSVDGNEPDPTGSNNSAEVVTRVLYTVGGTVSGLAGNGLVLRNDGGDDLKIQSNGPFTFDEPVASGASYRVTVRDQPTHLSQTCTVSNGSGTVGAANVTNVSVTCVTDRFTVGGSISGLAGGNQVVLELNGGNAITEGNGGFTFPNGLTDGSDYEVTVAVQPTTPNQTCTVDNGSGTLDGRDVTNVRVECVTRRYDVGGTVSGLSGDGLVLRNNGGNNLNVSSNGAFTFSDPVDDGAGYNVTVFRKPSDPSQTCTVSNGSGTVSGGNVTNVGVHCTTDSFTVGGTVSGLASGNQVVLENNGRRITEGNGPFEFPPQLDESSYDVTVVTQPTTPNQVCTVSNGSGRLDGADVTNVSVTCVTRKYTVGGTVSGLVFGNQVELELNGGNAIIRGNGGFTFPEIADGSDFVVTVSSQPTTPSQTCTVANGSGTLSGENVTNVTVTCVVDGYTVGGIVTGLAPGNQVQLRLNLFVTITESNGPFQFPPLADGSPYLVVVSGQPPNQFCTVSNGTGVVNGRDVDDVIVSCVTP